MRGFKMDKVKQKIKQKNIKIWDKAASILGNVGPDYWKNFGSRLVEISEISKGASIVDIGTGRGAVLFPAIKKVGEQGKVIGIDISKIMVRETQKDILKQNIKNAKVLHMDAEKLEFDDNCFDNVTCGFSIGYILFDDVKLKEVLRVLKKEGQASFSIWGILPHKEWLMKIFAKYLDSSLFDEKNNLKLDVPKFNTVDDMRKILENAGLRNIEVYEEYTDLVYKDKEQWWEEMWASEFRGLLEQVEELGFNKLEKIKTDIFEGLEKHKKEDGFHFNLPVIYALGEK
jgi:ubiquinone/menaquinone biosynthesis C-methylase UbiE